jgi:subfamily B ATP-binding cassette protein MsbA
MKIYFRLLGFTGTLGRYLILYFIPVLLAVFFSLGNFGLLIPLLDVLFMSPETNNAVLTEPPAFSADIDFFKDSFNYYFQSISQEKGRKGALLFVCVLIFSSVLLSNLFKYLSQRVIASLRTRMIANLRNAIFAKVNRLHLAYFQSQRKGEVLTFLSADINEIENTVVNSVQIFLREPLMLIGLIAVLFSISVPLSLFSLIVLPLSGLLISFITRKLRRQTRLMQKFLDSILSLADETLGGMRVIKAFNAENYITTKFQSENESYRKNLRSIWNRRELASPLSEFLGVSVVLSLLWYGGQLVLDGESSLKASAFITYLVFFSQMLQPLKHISNSITAIQRGLVSGERIFDFLDKKEELQDRPESKAVEGFDHSIKLDQISFSYGEESVIDNITLDITKGSSLALVGPSGAGKSTLADLIVRFYDVSEGAILCDDIDIKQLQSKAYRSLFGIVPQEAILFNDTIYNNIVFGRTHVSKQEVEQAAKIAQAHDFISRFENGYETMAGERGSRLSGGQKQRISIARAILGNPEILVLDEATSALDTESEKLIQKAVEELMRTKTVIVIAHRLSTIQNADRIAVLNEGRVEQLGRHEELMKQKGLYQKLVHLQDFR